MAVAQLQRIIDALLAAGMARQTPAAAIERGTWGSQRVVQATVATLAMEASRAALSSPAIVVVGECVALAPAIAPAIAPLSARKVA
jgi:uroporphyrinogen III methyltransferase/synthase